MKAAEDLAKSAIADGVMGALIAFIDQGFVAPWTAAAHRQNEVVVGAAAATAGRLATGGYTVVYDGVIGPWFLETFGAATGLAFLHYAILLPPEQVCLERERVRRRAAPASSSSTARPAVRVGLPS